MNFNWLLHIPVTVTWSRKWEGGLKWENSIPLWFTVTWTIKQGNSQDAELSWNQLQSQTRVEVLGVIPIAWFIEHMEYVPKVCTRTKCLQKSSSNRVGQKYHLSLHIIGLLSWNQLNCIGHVLQDKPHSLPFLSHIGVSETILGESEP